MEKRFTVKDFLLFALLIGLVVSVWFAIEQSDREYKELQTLNEQIKTLSNVQSEMRSTLSTLDRRLKNGVAVAPTTSDPPDVNDEPNTDDADSPFARLEAARAGDGFAEGDVLIDAFGTLLVSVTALTYKDAYGARIQNYVLESLAGRDPDTLEWYGLLAEDWTIDDNSANYNAWLDVKKSALDWQLQADPNVIDDHLQKLVAALEEADESVPEPGTPEAEALRAQAAEQWRDQKVQADKNRPPAMTIAFTLRPDVNFSDGTRLTAHDVQFTWELLNNPKLDAPQTRNFFDNVETFVALDDRTIRFTFREPHYLAFSMVAGFSVLPEHFYGPIDIEELNTTPGLLMGSGPYQLPDPRTWAPGKLMRLERNENYWGVKPALRGLVWLEIQKDVPRLTEFKNGGIDLFVATPEQYEEMIHDARVTDRTEPAAFQAVPSGYNFVAWNVERHGEPTLFADKRVRQAMTFLIDRHRIAEEVMLGHARPTSGPFDPATQQSDPELQPRRFNAKRAMALLNEAGWRPGDDGILQNAAGDDFIFTLTYPSGNDTYERVMLFIKDTLLEHGIIMQQDPQEWSIFIERVDGRAFDACALAWGGGAIEGDIRQMFHSSQIANGANNFTNYRNPELDRLIDEARRTIDEPQRMKLWQACHRILYEDQPYTFLLRRKSLRFIDKRFKNTQMVRVGMNDRTEWYVPTLQQKRQ